MSEMNVRNHSMRLMFVGMIACFLASLLAPITHAAQPSSERSGIAMSPAEIKYEFNAGTVNRDNLKVTNVGATTYTLKMYAEPYSVKNETYEADFLTVKKNTDLQEWVTFDKTSYIVTPGQSVEVGYTINVPANAAPGGHYGIIFAETQPSNKNNDSTSLLGRKRIGAPIFATIKGDYKMGGQFLGIETAPLQFEPPLVSDLSVENTGNSHFAVETVFAVSDVFGNRKLTQTNEYDLLPQSIHKIPLKWEKSPGFGLFKVTVSAKFLDKKTTKTSYVLMAPLAYYMIFVIGLLVSVIVFVAKRR